MKVVISYADAFSDNTDRNTFAYPTTVTDPDNNSATSKYNFDFGAVTYKQTPSPNPPTPGPEQTFSYDPLGRLLQVTNVANNSYSRFDYSNFSQLRVDNYRTVQDGLGEAHSFEITDGVGRTIGTASQHPGSDGGYSGQRQVYDIMGRLFKTSNPTETTASGSPFVWTTAGDDSSAGWIFTEQTYDWKGRPRITIQPSMTSDPSQTTTKQVTYTGCGCAGGELITLTDEVGRRRRIYKDVLGRTSKLESLNWDGTVYSTVVNTYDVRDLLTLVKEYAGPEGSATVQQTTRSYDGYGRLQSQHLPEEEDGTQRTWTYNSDDTVHSTTDPRGASQTFTYNNRHLMTSIVYAAPNESGVSVPAPVTYTYDAAGNRKKMMDGFGEHTYQYDQLSRLIQESRQLPVGTMSIGYSYNLAGHLSGLTDPFGASFTFTRDLQGRLKSVAGSSFGGVTSYITDIDYRAFGEAGSVTYQSTSATTSYNARMLPTEFRLTENGTGNSIIREDYSYFHDGNLATLTDLDDTGGSNPPSTLRFLSRAYAYDQLGRTAVGRGNGGAGFAVPFTQTYGYDAFDNLRSRSGSYYNYMNASPTITDNATYTNNRRNGWTYNANGQVTNTPASGTDQARTTTYDAAGRLISSVETGSSSTTTYAAAYDGDGEVIFETSTTSPGSSGSAYFVRSTVLDGEVVTRVDQSGNKQVTHVPTFGLLIARQVIHEGLSIVALSHRNPWGTTETTRNVFDPLGNYIPFQAPADPRPPAGSYSSASLSGLGVTLANPHAYGNGCLLDGTPVNCNLAMRLLNNGSAAKCPQNDCGARMVEGRLRPLYLTEDGYAIWVERRKSDAPKLRQANRRQTAQEQKQREKQRQADIKKIGNSEDERARVDNISFWDLLSTNLKIEHFADQRKQWIEAALKPLFTSKCSEAYENAGLMSPTKTVFGAGVIIRPATDLLNSTAEELGLVSEATVTAYRNAFFNGGAFSNSQAGTIPNIRDGHRITKNGMIQIYLHGSAFAGASLIFNTDSLDDVLSHEFMHAGGQPPTPGFWGSWRHDLAGFKSYNTILEACR